MYANTFELGMPATRLFKMVTYKTDIRDFLCKN